MPPWPPCHLCLERSPIHTDIAPFAGLAQGACRPALRLPFYISRLQDWRARTAAVTNSPELLRKLQPVRRPPASPAPRSHFTSYAGSQTHGAVACKARAQDTKHKEPLAEGRSQGARNVLRVPTPGRYGAGAAAGRKHVCIATLVDAEHARSCVPV